MVKGILSEVIEVEKEIQKRLEIERLNAHEWLEKIRREAADETAGEEARLKEAFNRAMKDARAYAERKASGVISDANAQAERLSRVKDEVLKKAVVEHIIRILPEE